MANNEDTLIREVEEELRRERMEQLWNRYGTYVLAGAVCMVIAVGAFQFYKWRSVTAANKAGAAYDTAENLVEDGKPAEALAAFKDLAGNGPSGYAALARLQVAGAQFKAGKTAEAITAYEALINDSSADPLLRSFATLQAEALKIGDGDFTEVENRLNDLANDDGPWRANARELIAVAALNANKLDKARSRLEQILADRTTPTSVRDRAQIMMAKVIEAELAKSAPSKPAAPAAPPAGGNEKGAGQGAAPPPKASDAAPSAAANGAAPAPAVSPPAATGAGAAPADAQK